MNVNMKLNLRRLFSLGFVVILVSLALSGFGRAGRADAEESLWTSDFAAAKEKAKAEKKYLLCDFTGSDWCIWCKRLHAEVFDKDAFQSEAPKQFVLVELDYPHTKKLPDEEKAQNEKLEKEYKIQGFPTVILMDAEGQVMAKTGYRPGGPEKYVAELGDFLKIYAETVEMKAQLAKVEGLDRAKLLDKLIGAYDKLNNPSDEMTAWSKQIVELDADNKAGLKTKYEVRLVLAEAEKLAMDRKLADALAALDKGLKLPGLSGEQKQDLYLMQDRYGLNRKDLAARAEFLKTALAAAPESENAPRINAMLKSLEAAVQMQKAIAKNVDAADKATGVERAKLLDKIIEASGNLARLGVSAYPSEKIAAWRKEILELDADNKAGLKNKYELDNLLLESQALAGKHKFDDVQASLDKALALSGLTTEQTQHVLMLKGNYYLNVNDFPKATEYLKKALDLAPQGRWSQLTKMLLDRAEKEVKTDPGARS